MGDAQSQQQEGFAGIHGAPNTLLQGVPCASGIPAVPGAVMPGTTANAAQRQQGDQAALAVANLSEPALLSQLVQLLGQRVKHSLLLSDLGALLPGPLRHGVKERGGLRSWLQKYPQLFLVSGQPGKESVTLLLGTEGAVNVAATGTARTQAVAQPLQVGPLPSRTEPKAVAKPLTSEGNTGIEAEQKAFDDGDDDDENQAAVQLRGLPYRATIQDIKMFLGKHVDNLKDDSSIQLVLNRDGRPSGFSRVQFVSFAAAKAARDDLHMRTMELPGGQAANNPTSKDGQSQDRYVEIFLYSERPNKLRFKKTATDSNVNDLGEDPEILGITNEQVIRECMEHMSSPGKGQLLLSMLGVALSHGARMYLKKTDQGLKHFLAQYPNEFSVDGQKGRECVSYFPALKSMSNNSDLPGNFEASNTRSKAAPPAPNRGNAEIPSARQTPPPGASGSLADLRQQSEDEAWVPESPSLGPRATPLSRMQTPGEGTPRGLKTPSDWGTPQRFGMSDRAAVASSNQADVAASMASQFAPGATAAAYNNVNWSAWTMPPPTYWPPPAMWQFMGAPPWMNGAGPDGLPNQPEPALAAAAQAWAQQHGTNPLASLFGDGQLPTAQTSMQPMPPLAPGTAAAQGAQSAALRLRGLPFSATEQDVLAFFAKYDVVEHVAEVEKAVKMITKVSGKPSGQAVVHMVSKEAAATVQEVLHGKWIGSRYIEVFPHSEGEDERANNGAAKGAGANGGTGASVNNLGVWAGAGTGTSMAGLPQALLGQHAPGVLPWQVSPEEVQNYLQHCDGLGDTGGSGGDAPVGASLPVTPSNLQGKQAVAATGNKGEGEESSWEELFDFLNRGELEAPVAMPGMANSDCKTDFKACEQGSLRVESM